MLQKTLLAIFISPKMVASKRNSE